MTTTLTQPAKRKSKAMPPATPAPAPVPPPVGTIGSDAAGVYVVTARVAEGIIVERADGGVDLIPPAKWPAAPKEGGRVDTASRLMIERAAGHTKSAATPEDEVEELLETLPAESVILANVPLALQDALITDAIILRAACVETLKEANMADAETTSACEMASLLKLCVHSTRDDIENAFYWQYTVARPIFKAFADATGANPHDPPAELSAQIVDHFRQSRPRVK